MDISPYAIIVGVVAVVVALVMAVSFWEAPVAEARIKACHDKGGILLSARDIKPSVLCIRKEAIINIGESK